MLVSRIGGGSGGWASVPLWCILLLAGVVGFTRLSFFTINRLSYHITGWLLNQMFINNFCLNMFRASLCPSSGEQRPCYCIWCTVLALLDVVGSGCGLCVVGCEQCSKHVETEVDNKHLIVASCWFFSLHTLLTIHGHRNLKLKNVTVCHGGEFHSTCKSFCT